MQGKSFAAAFKENELYNVGSLALLLVQNNVLWYKVQVWFT